MLMRSNFYPKNYDFSNFDVIFKKYIIHKDFRIFDTLTHYLFY